MNKQELLQNSWLFALIPWRNIIVREINPSSGWESKVKADGYWSKTISKTNEQMVYSVHWCFETETVFMTICRDPHLSCVVLWCRKSEAVFMTPIWPVLCPGVSRLKHSS